MKSITVHIRAIVVLACAVWLIGNATATSLVFAALPPRPTPEPPPPVPPADTNPYGGWMELDVAAQSATGLASVVQWQDSAGTWHDIEGWRGAFDTSAGGVSTKKWWYDQWILGQGPFRWIVYRGDTGQNVGESKPFSLPTVPRLTLVVDVPLAQ